MVVLLMATVIIAAKNREQETLIMKQLWTAVFAISLTWVSLAIAQEGSAGDGAAEGQEASTDTARAEEMVSPFALKTYTGGDLWKRSHLTGDWGGLRNELAEKGITFELDLSQLAHFNFRGGKSTNNGFRYSGSVDYTITLDTGRMGWWPAGQLLLKGETQFGQSLNGKVGSIMAPNTAGLFPNPDTQQTTLTDVVFTQFFSEHFGISLGKIDFRGGDSNVFAHSEKTQFMNLALLANPVLLSLAPYTALNATLIFRPTDWLITTFTALDSFGTPTTTGFDTAFHSPEGTAFLNEWDFTIKPFGLEGHQRFGVVYSTKDFLQLDQDQRLGGPIRLLRALRSVMSNPQTKPDDWALYYNFDQYLYTEKDDATQGLGIFGRIGWSTGEANPIEGFYSIGLGGKGIITERDHDTFGLGYYYMDMSDNLASFISLDTEQGIEFFYNIEVTPWWHITPDLQYIIDPGGGAYDDAFVFGIRTVMIF